ncbi:MAG: metallophosphoesterase [Methanothrix sp.]|uniref:Phosphoesterase n=1 Tax=Methanothrix thermoacetophila (strain DSM 6194 / JCM 14653 / NBRC 101360 / PT) TaxID=349307 RepID=A0B9I4_METTP|nr:MULTISPECIES: metallophosphoesterase [Methanothrix]ABK15358.1 phosphodiesterase, MJ0936 family [Methanothrix thermoacetophila PT]MBC7080222.1 metallophosphoesterase [Methanothrix sp.]NPU87384.1 metallophosphoesterase [Methanothrix sp.]
MLIGIMSDSHDNFRGIKEALGVFSKRDVKLVLHAGDVIGSGNAYLFDGYGIPVRLVYGNNDGDRVGLSRYFERFGGEYLGDFGELEVDGLRIAMLHGTEEPLVRAVVTSGLYDVVVRGHTHVAEVRREGRTLVVNPGEIWGHLTGVRSVAIMDTSTTEVEIVELGRCETFREILQK